MAVDAVVQRRRGHKARLRAAQDLWDAGRTYDAIAELEAVAGHLHPAHRETDALIAGTLAGYLADIGDPWRGLEMLEWVSFDGIEGAKPPSSPTLVLRWRSCSTFLSAW